MWQRWWMYGIDYMAHVIDNEFVYRIFCPDEDYIGILFIIIPLNPVNVYSTIF